MDLIMADQGTRAGRYRTLCGRPANTFVKHQFFKNLKNNNL